MGISKTTDTNKALFISRGILQEHDRYFPSITHLDALCVWNMLMLLVVSLCLIISGSR
jgi:hypothetical protein